MDFEIVTALNNTLDYQVGSQHISLQAGDSIFVNGNILHGIKQVSGEKADSMPNIVFSSALLGLQDSAIYKRYVLPILQCDSLSFIVF